MARGRTKGDHDAKRVEIGQAACKAILRLGLGRASLADIAREMGYSTGVLRHYFPDKEELLLFVKNTLYDRAYDRARLACERNSGIGKLTHMAEELMALDSESIDRQRLLATFNGYAIGDVRLMKLQHKRNERSWQLFEEAIEALQRDGLLSPQLDPGLEAFGILAYIDGLGEQVTMNAAARSPQEMLGLLHRYIDTLRDGRLPERQGAADQPPAPRPQKKRPTLASKPA